MYQPDRRDDENEEDEEVEPCPDDLHFHEQPFSLGFHPSRDLLAVGLFEGAVSVVRYSTEGNEVVLDARQLHKSGGAVKQVRFDVAGTRLLSAGSDGALVMTDVETLGETGRKRDAHGAGISAMVCYGRPNSEASMVATGDDEGVVKIWDLRQEEPVCVIPGLDKEYVSDLDYEPHSNLLAASSAGGHVSVFNARSGKVKGRSEHTGQELLSVQWMKKGKMMVAGTTEGQLLIWRGSSWDAEVWRACEVLEGQPESVDCLLKLDEDVLATGSMDGMIRIVQMHPGNQRGLLGLVGDHGDMPIEALDMSYNNRFVASSSHDDCVKFWNIDYWFEGHQEEADEEEAAAQADAVEAMDEGDDELDNRGKKVAKPEPLEQPISKNKQKKAEFFSGL